MIGFSRATVIKLSHPWIPIIPRFAGKQTASGADIVSQEINCDGNVRGVFKLNITPKDTDWDSILDGSFLDVIVERSEEGGPFTHDTTAKFRVGSRTGKGGNLDHFLELPLYRIVLPLNPDGTNERNPDGTIKQLNVPLVCKYRVTVRLPRTLEVGVDASLN